MEEIFLDAVIDIAKLIPFLFVAFLILEYIEHKMSKKNSELLAKNRKMGPVIGGILGTFPQCGFSCVATKLFSSRVITLGTLIAIYLSTSDEMIPIMITSGVSFIMILKIIGIKLVIGIFFGFIIDLLFQKGKDNHQDNIHNMCLHDDCHCEKGIIRSSIQHTLNIILYLFLGTLLINFLIYFIGEENISNFLINHKSIMYFISCLIGLIPNCASSVILTEIYINGMISVGVLLSGLLAGSGVGLLLLFKTNKNIKQNILILFLLYVIGVIMGFLIDLMGIVI